MLSHRIYSVSSAHDALTFRGNAWLNCWVKVIVKYKSDVTKEKAFMPQGYVKRYVALEADSLQQQSSQTGQQLKTLMGSYFCSSDHYPYYMAKKGGHSSNGLETMVTRSFCLRRTRCFWFARFSTDSKWQKYLGEQLIKSGFKYYYWKRKPGTKKREIPLLSLKGFILCYPCVKFIKATRLE